MRNHLQEKKTAFEGGATRSEKLEHLELIPVEALISMGRRHGLGAMKHGEGNWKKGGAGFIKQCLNHALIHYCTLITNCDNPGHDDDDLDAIACNVDMLLWFRSNKPALYQRALLELKWGKEEMEDRDRAATEKVRKK
jgi:hypothetical protein